MGRSGIAFYPVLRARQLTGTRRPLPGALSAPGALRLRRARTGLRLIAAALEPGGHVLLPDLLCRSAIEPFAANGLRPIHYRVGPDLQPDLDDLRARIAGRPVAVMVVSYFGLAQPFEEIRAMCAEAEAVLIDDAAHSLLSEWAGRPFGTFGDVGVVSIHKTLPAPDGAALLPGRLDVRDPGHLDGSPHSPGAYLLRTLLRNVDEALGLDVMGRRARRLSGGLPAEDEPQPAEGLGWSRLTERLVSRIDPKLEREIRRRAYSAWPALLEGSGGVPLAGELAPGVCPSGFPVRIDDEHAFADRTEELRVEWIRWPDRPELSAEFPGGVAVLPTHTVPA